MVSALDLVYRRKVYERRNGQFVLSISLAFHSLLPLMYYSHSQLHLLQFSQSFVNFNFLSSSLSFFPSRSRVCFSSVLCLCIILSLFFHFFAFFHSLLLERSFLCHFLPLLQPSRPLIVSCLTLLSIVSKCPLTSQRQFRMVLQAVTLRDCKSLCQKLQRNIKGKTD